MCLLSIFANQINLLTTDRFLVQPRNHLMQRGYLESASRLRPIMISPRRSQGRLNKLTPSLRVLRALRG